MIPETMLISVINTGRKFIRNEPIEKSPSGAPILDTRRKDSPLSGSKCDKK
jgi:hypothetical protein